MRSPVYTLTEVYPITSDLLPIPDHIRGLDNSSDEDDFLSDRPFTAPLDNQNNHPNNIHIVPDTLHYNNDNVLNHDILEDALLNNTSLRNDDNVDADNTDISIDDGIHLSDVTLDSIADDNISFPTQKRLRKQR